MLIPNSKISDISFKESIMIVKFQNGDTLRFVDVKEWEYDNIMLSKDKHKSLIEFAKYKPNY